MNFYWGKEVTNDCSDEKRDIIKSVFNRIYFYSDINSTNVLNLVQTLKQNDNEFIVKSKELNLENLIPIYLHIQSYGGEIFSGFSAMDNILMCKSPVITIVDGVCASAGTFLSIVGKKRLITKNSYMLIHQLSSFHWGKYSELEDQKQNMDNFMIKIKEIYTEYTKIPKVVLDDILKHDLFFDSNKCLEYGLVDEII
jgi:ATP-dependent Clp protease protease subunit